MQRKRRHSRKIRHPRAGRPNLNPKSRRRPPRGRSSRAELIGASVVGTLLIAFTLLLAGGVVSDFLDARAPRDHGVYADGVIVKVHHGSGRRRDYVVAEFTTRDGRQVTAEVDNIYWRPEPQVGDRTSVVYDPAKPADNVADAGRTTSCRGGTPSSP